MDYAYGSPIESYISDPQPGPQNPAFMPGLYHMRAESSSSGSSNSSLSPQISPLISQNNALGLHANYGQWSDFSFESEVKRSNQIASASHQDLLEARNAPYTQLHQSYTTLQIQFKTLKESFHTLSTSLQGSGPPARTSTHFSLPIGPTALLERNDHPKVRFWTRDDFNKVGGKKKTTSINSERPRRGNTRMTQDINVMFTFLEQADGTILSGKEAQAVRRHATTAFLEIHTNYPDLVPATWGVAPLSIVNYVRSELYAAYPCLRLCVGHWKCDLLLTTIYTNWYKSRKKTSTPRSDGCQCPCSCAAAKVEDEISDPEQDDDVAVDVHSRIGQKRKSSSKSSFTPSTLAKRQRLSPSDSPALLATPDTDPILPLAPTSSPPTLPLAASPICSVSPPDTSSTSASSSTTPSPPLSMASHAPRTPSLTVSTPLIASPTYSDHPGRINRGKNNWCFAYKYDYISIILSRHRWDHRVSSTDLPEYLQNMPQRFTVLYAPREYGGVSPHGIYAGKKLWLAMEGEECAALIPQDDDLEINNFPDKKSYSPLGRMQPIECYCERERTPRNNRGFTPAGASQRQRLSPDAQQCGGEYTRTLIAQAGFS
ncbi:hypothetical protein C8J57DRAFT_1231233 [Mycena rebaudengoi]|nr:hypothetical protein C8J57DRAFT_1231233 [Mycena rebaudengoi]